MDINFKEKVMKEAKYIFHDDLFLNRFDENHHLIGFENGVYYLKLKKFRAGQPDDHISMSTKQQYVKWNDNNPYAKYIKHFFEQVMPIEAVRKYLLTRLSTCLSGENRDEIFWYGSIPFFPHALLLFRKESIIIELSIFDPIDTKIFSDKLDVVEKTYEIINRHYEPIM
jgi:hypothetical protein